MPPSAEGAVNVTISEFVPFAAVGADIVAGTVVAVADPEVVVKPFPKLFLGVMVNVYDVFDANP